MENKPKVLGYAILHYGKEYWREALLSVVNHVDKFVVLYTDQCSQGHGTELSCPDSREELYKIAEEVLGEKLIWEDGVWGHEAHHRDAVTPHTQGFDVLVNVDADEVYNQEDLPKAIQKCFEGRFRYGIVKGFVNLWKNFKTQAKDEFRPVRFTNLNRTGGQEEIMCRIYHFSCAQSRETISYKWQISGHKDELRPDWFSIYDAWSAENRLKLLHPVSLGVWLEAVDFNPEEMPDFMRSHKNWGIENIM